MVENIAGSRILQQNNILPIYHSVVKICRVSVHL
jgi:hypothetical protein